MSEIQTMIESLGFPVMCVVGLAMYVNKIHKEILEMQTMQIENSNKTNQDLSSTNRELMSANKELLETNRTLAESINTKIDNIENNLIEINNKLSK